MPGMEYRVLWRWYKCRAAVYCLCGIIGTSTDGVMVAASTWRPLQLSSEGTNATDQTSTAPAARTPCPTREMVRLNQMGRCQNKALRVVTG